MKALPLLHRYIFTDANEIEIWDSYELITNAYELATNLKLRKIVKKS